MKIRYHSRLTALDGLALYWPAKCIFLSGGNAEIPMVRLGSGLF